MRILLFLILRIPGGNDVNMSLDKPNVIERELFEELGYF